MRQIVARLTLRISAARFWGSSRHLVENTLQRLKSARRMATRYEQTVCVYSAFVHLACVMFWLW